MLQLKNKLYWVGVQDSELRVFDIIMRTEFGTTYNSYLIQGSEKTALVETVKAEFFDQFVERAKSVCDLTKIDYVVVNHTEPDHVGSLEKLLDLCPHLKVVSTQSANLFLKHILNRDFDGMVVKDQDTLSLGDRDLQFHILPNLHWPDTMYTYDSKGKVLFTCDSFGSHYSFDGILRSRIDEKDVPDYLSATKYYFDNILGPFKRPFMTNALKRIETLSFDMICPGHGPVLDSHLDELIALYRSWCQDERIDDGRKLVVIPYVSSYGYTRSLAEHIEKGVRDSGPVDVLRYDMVEQDSGPVLDKIQVADGLLFGTPTILGDALKPIWDLVTSMLPATHGGKHAAAFGSYGWSGEGPVHITERLKQLKCKVQDPLRIRFKPSLEQQQEAYDYGYSFGKTVLGQH